MKTSNLPAAGALAGAEKLHVVQGGQSRRTTLAAILALGTEIGTEGASVIASIFETLNAPAGATEIGYQASGAGARAMDASEKLSHGAVSVLDYGTAAEVAVNVVPALQEALTAIGANGGEIVFPKGHTYRFAEEMTVTGRSRIRFTGWGAKITGADVRSYFNLVNCSDISFEGFSFDGMFGDVPPYLDFATGERQVPIRAIGSLFIKAKNNWFDRLYTAHIVFRNGGYLDVSNNSFSSPLQNQDQYLSFVEILSSGGSIIVSRNNFLAADTVRNDRSPSAVTASGVSGSLDVVENTMVNCGRNNAGTHRLAAIDIYADATNVTVKANKAINCREQFMRLSTTNRARIKDNFVTVSPYADVTYSTMTIESGSFPAVAQPVCKDIRISGNSFIDVANRQAFCIGIGTYDWGAAAQTIRIDRNNIIGQATAFRIWGPLSDVTIERNAVRDVVAFVDMSLEGDVATTSVLGVEAVAAFEDICIERNDVVLRPGSAPIPISISTNRAAPFTGKVGEFKIRQNKIKCTAPGTAIAVNVIINASVKQGRVVIAENDISGYVTPFYVRSMKSASIVSNKAQGFNQLYLTDGTVDTIDTRENRRGDGAIAGTALLGAGGQVVIPTTEVVAGDRVEIWRETPAGALGHLSCDPADIVPNVSFLAKSSSGTETSRIGWRLLR